MSDWNLEFCAGYIVEPRKGQETSKIKDSLVGFQINIANIPTEFFLKLFAMAPDKYPINVAFIPEEGKQENEIRTLIRNIAFAKSTGKEVEALALAVQLAGATDNRSQSGLLVILSGKTKKNHRVILWKFPADESLRMLIKGTKKIELVRDVFSRKGTYYKAAMFEGSTATTSFWKGKVQDNQAQDTLSEAAEFWIKDFLCARSELTNVHGTRIASKALKKLIDKTKELDRKESLVAAARVLREQSGKRTSFKDIADTYLPVESRPEFIETTGTEEISQQTFQLDKEVIEKQFKYKSIILDDEYMVKGPLDKFDEEVKINPIDKEGKVEVSLTGKITSESVRTQ